MAKPKTTLDWRLLLLLPIPVLWCVAGHYGWLQFLENRTIDWRFRYRGEIPAPVKVVYVDIDSRTIDDIGNWPWSRSYFAEVSDVLLNVAHVRAIGFDFVFSTNGQAESADRQKLIEGDMEFGRFLYRGPPVVLGASFTATEFRAAEGRIRHRDLPLVVNGIGDPAKIEPPEVTALQVPGRPPWTPPNIGLIDTYEGGTRTVPVWAPTSIGNFYHASLQLARLYWGMPPGSIKVAGDAVDFVWPDGRVQARVPLRRGQFVDVNWFSRWLSKYNPRESFSIVYAYARMLRSEKPEERATAGKFFAQGDWKDSVVLVGPVDPLLQDIATTPMDDLPVPRVGVHGNLLKTIVSGRYLRRVPGWSGVLIALALTLLVTVLVVKGGTRSIAAKVTAVLLAVVYVGLAFQLFDRFELELPLAVPLASAFTTSFAALIWQVVKEEKQKGRIKGLFGTYLSPELVNRMVESGEDPQLGGHEETITAYFSDIQSFSSFSEKMSPGLLVELMNEYLTACTDIVQEEGGTLDKYIGDAVVAMFGAPLPLPDHAVRACIATQRVQRRIAELREKWRGEGDRWPDVVPKLRARLGLNTGPAIIGNMGSRSRFSYTMMGDNVNLAARMESGAKSWGVYTMVTEATRQECEAHSSRIVFRPLAKLVVMGRKQPVPVYEVVGVKEDVRPETWECLGVFTQAMEKYYAQDWDGAVTLFRRSAGLEPLVPGRDSGVKTNPSLVYQEVCAEFKREPPPSDWNGVYVMKEK